MSRWPFTIGLLLACAGGGWPSAQEPADLVLYNGNVYTVDGLNTVAEAVAVAGGRITVVGATADVLTHAGGGTRRIDLRGKTVIPGLIDSHGHLLNLGRSLQTLDVTGTQGYEEIVERVAERVRTTPRGQWITGRGWDQNDWPETDFPHHEALSLVSPHHPVYLTRVDGHAGLANGLALKMAGMNRDVADPPGGRILRDAQGDPTGVLVDTAQNLVRRYVPGPSETEAKEALVLAIGECLRYGLTSVHDAGVSAEDLALYREAIDAGAFHLRVYAMVTARSPESVQQYLDAGPTMDYGDHRLTVRSIKAVADGALGSRGAALLEAYSDEPGNVGLLIIPGERMKTLTEAALRAGFQVCTHAIGDRGNRTVLDAYESALATVPSGDPRLRIEHAQIVSLTDIPRFATMGIIPSMQATHATSDMYWAEERVGSERIQGAYAWRKFIEAGCRIANGSDFPVEGVNPLWGFYASITRQDNKGWPSGGWRPQERMTREEALRSFTIDAAYAAFEEDLKGSIEKGKLADLVVLSQDIMTIEPKAILDTTVAMTLLGGEIVYESED